MSRRDFRAARRLFELGLLDGAERVYRRILKAAPNDALAWHNLAIVQYRQGHVLPAVETLKTALGKDSVRPEYYLTMAEFITDPAFKAHLKTPFAGPFNGQEVRQQIFTQIVALTDPRVIFETGTFHGTTTNYMAERTTGHIFSCELEPNYFRFASRRFSRFSNVTVVQRDSRSFLETHVPSFAPAAATSLFYLDAHWNEDDLPLLEELAIVFEHAPRSIVMIDDFEVWDDAGYVFDDYGPGRKLSLHYLAPLARFQARCFFPISSTRETGLRRGCVVLTCDPTLAELLASIPQLRPAPPPEDAASTAP